MKQIENNPVKEKSRALSVIKDDEGFNWNDFLPDENQIGSALVAEVKESAFVVVVKKKTKEEILKEKTYRERCIVDYIVQEMEQEYEEARNYGRYDKK
ncbi:hypothetical protein Hanom_Chr04g00283761 [Helianthus anomalus]